MKIRNIVISNKEKFKEVLIGDLERGKINYIQDNDEFCFQDKAFHFYDKETDIEQITRLQKENRAVVFIEQEENRSKEKRYVKKR